MTSTDELEQRIDSLYAQLADLKREVILNRPVRKRKKPSKAWADFLALSAEVSALWEGPGAVEEIRSQRER